VTHPILAEASVASLGGLGPPASTELLAGVAYPPRIDRHAWAASSVPLPSVRITLSYSPYSAVHVAPTCG
jgi:hypothetical protein